MITAITVDFWNTLFFDRPRGVDRHKARRLADFAAMLRAAGERVSLAALDRAYEESGDYLGRLWSAHRDVPVEEHVRVILAGVDPALPGRLGAEVAAALVDAYSRPALIDPPSVEPDALAALERLRARGYALAVVSNTMRTPGTALRHLLERAGLLGCFKHVVFSDEAGVRKPDPAIFRLALDALGGEAGCAVHVGDDPVLDVHGARAAGMRVVQVVSAPIDARGAERPDASIAYLAELPDVIAGLDRAST